MSFILSLLGILIFVGFIWNFVFIMGAALFIGVICNVGVMNAQWWLWAGAVICIAGILVGWALEDSIFR